MSSNVFAQLGYGRATLVTGELRGYRCWNVREDFWTGRPMLTAIAFSAPWRDGHATARCITTSRATHGDDGVPARYCTCGIYNWYLPRHARTAHHGQLIGVTSNVGKTQLGTLGFRTSESRVIAVCVNWSYGFTRDQLDLLKAFRTRRVRRVRIAHNAYVTVYPSLRRMMRAHPPDLATLHNLGLDPTPPRLDHHEYVLRVLDTLANCVTIVVDDVERVVAATWRGLVVSWYLMRGLTHAARPRRRRPDRTRDQVR